MPHQRYVFYERLNRYSEGGNKVHLLYWNVKPLLENLGAGTVAAATTFMGNGEASRMYGNVLDANVSVTLQKFLRKFAGGEPMRLYNNEIKGIKAFDWRAFPQALIVSDKKFLCEPIADKLTEVNGLLEFITR